jgi:hypothetical protein
MHLNNNKRKAQCLTNQLATSKNGFGNLSQQKDGGINDKRKVANLLHRVTFQNEIPLAGQTKMDP